MTKMATRDTDNISIEVARVIPTKSQTADTFPHDEEALHAPPSYEGSAPLLGDDGNDNEHSATGNNIDDGDAKLSPTNPVWLGPFSFFVFLLLFLTPLAFWGIAVGSKVDLLGFSVLAFLLLFALLLAPVILAILVRDIYPLSH